MNEIKEKILRFKIGEETYPTVLDREQLKDSPFNPIIESSIRRIEELYSNSAISSPEGFSWKYSTPNNVLAFLGDRGTGKTSCMRTLVKYCQDVHDDWMILDEIDPSFFDETHNILEIFVGTLYGKFKEDTKDWDKLSRKDQETLRGIQGRFRDVKSAMRYLDKKPSLKDEFEIDELRHLNEGGILRDLLKNLVYDYLNYKSKNYLVISIDDLDLNISCSYEMMEYIRKYLLMPKLAIIIAAKYSQLFDNVCLVLTRHYKEIEYLVSHKEIAEMAERYLNKLLPQAQRFEMPDVNSYLDAILEIIDDKNPLNDDERMSVSLRVPSLIFAKTRYLFYNSSGIPSLVIPRNLRELKMLVSMLWAMEDFMDDDLGNNRTIAGINHENQRLFKNYFFQEWMGIIEPEYRMFVRHLLEEENLAKINRFVISNLYDFFLKDVESFSQIASELKELKSQGKTGSYVKKKELLYDILNPSNSYWNVSIGDVVIIMDTIKKIYDSSKVLSLLFLIESYYSIKLYETYNLMTEETDNTGLKTYIETRSSNPELKTGVRSDIPIYFRLIGGAFLSPRGDSFIPMAQNGKDGRETKFINGRVLFTEINEVVQEYIDRGFGTENFDKSNIPSELSSRLRLCEFFMLTVRERVNLRTTDYNRRLADEPWYFKPFGNNTKNLFFDVTAPFVNAVCPMFAYNRFNDKIFSIARNDKSSLLNKIRRHKKRGKSNGTWEIMSKASIRNLEILEDLTVWLLGRRSDIRLGNKGLIGAVYDFYNQFEIKGESDKMPVKGYCVKTYSKYSDEVADGKEKFYLIDYSIYSLLGKVLLELDDEKFSGESKVWAKRRKALFDAIMSENDIFIYKEKYQKSEIQEVLYPFCGHSVVDLNVGLYGDQISDHELAEILARITLDYRYDFSGRLPYGLQFYYNTTLLAMYESKLRSILQDKEGTEDKIADTTEEQSNLKEDIKAQKQVINQRKADIQKLKEAITRLESDIEADKKNISFITDNLHNTTTKTEYNRVMKGIEDCTRQLNAHEAALEESRNNLPYYQSLLESDKTELEDMENKLKSSTADIKHWNRNLDLLVEDEKRLKYNFEHRTPIESSL